MKKIILTIVALLIAGTVLFNNPIPSAQADKSLVQESKSWTQKHSVEEEAKNFLRAAGSSQLAFADAHGDVHAPDGGKHYGTIQAMLDEQYIHADGLDTPQKIINGLFPEYQIVVWTTRVIHETTLVNEKHQSCEFEIIIIPSDPNDLSLKPLGIDTRQDVFRWEGKELSGKSLRFNPKNPSHALSNNQTYWKRI